MRMFSSPGFEAPVLLVVGLLGVGLSASPLLAQKTDQPRQQATGAFKEAAAAVGNQHYEQAAEAFIQSAELFQKAGDQKHADKARSNGAKLLRRLGKEAISAGDPNQAISYLDRAIDLVGEDAFLRLAKAEVLRRQGEVADALDLYAEALPAALQRSDSTAARQLRDEITSIFIAEATKAADNERFETSLQYLRRAQKLGRRVDSKMYYQFGVVYNGLDQPDTAAEHARQGLKEMHRRDHSLQAQLYRQLGIAYESMGRLEVARAALEKAEEVPELIVP